MSEGRGYSIAVGACLVCGRSFGFNPEIVPSHPAKNGTPSSDPSDPKEPICEPCITIINERRREAGSPEWPIREGAYEPMEGWPSD